MILQLLNTFSNLGGTWPKYFVLKGKRHPCDIVTRPAHACKGVDYFTIATCKVKEAGADLTVKGTLNAPFLTFDLTHFC